MTKNVENCGHAFLTCTKSYLSTKNEIHSMMSPWLKTRQKTWFVCKDKYFRQEMWLRVLFFLLWYRIYKNWTIDTCFFYKLNVYKHVQPGISGRNKHMLNILASLETTSLLFSFLKSKACNGKICICFYSITNIIVFGNSH